MVHYKVRRRTIESQTLYLRRNLSLTVKLSCATSLDWFTSSPRRRGSWCPASSRTSRSAASSQGRYAKSTSDYELCSAGQPSACDFKPATSADIKLASRLDVKCSCITPLSPAPISKSTNLPGPIAPKCIGDNSCFRVSPF